LTKRQIKVKVNLRIKDKEYQKSIDTKEALWAVLQLVGKDCHFDNFDKDKDCLLEENQQPSSSTTSSSSSGISTDEKPNCDQNKRKRIHHDTTHDLDMVPVQSQLNVKHTSLLHQGRTRSKSSSHGSSSSSLTEQQIKVKVNLRIKDKYQKSIDTKEALWAVLQLVGKDCHFDNFDKEIDCLEENQQPSSSTTTSSSGISTDEKPNYNLNLLRDLSQEIAFKTAKALNPVVNNNEMDSVTGEDSNGKIGREKECYPNVVHRKYSTNTRDDGTNDGTKWNDGKEYHIRGDQVSGKECHFTSPVVLDGVISHQDTSSEGDLSSIFIDAQQTVERTTAQMSERETNRHKNELSMCSTSPAVSELLLTQQMPKSQHEIPDTTPLKQDKSSKELCTSTFGVQDIFSPGNVSSVAVKGAASKDYFRKNNVTKFNTKEKSVEDSDALHGDDTEKETTEGCSPVSLKVELTRRTTHSQQLQAFLGSICENDEEENCCMVTKKSNKIIQECASYSADSIENLSTKKVETTQNHNRKIYSFNINEIDRKKDPKEDGINANKIGAQKKGSSPMVIDNIFTQQSTTLDHDQALNKNNEVTCSKDRIWDRNSLTSTPAFEKLLTQPPTTSQEQNRHNLFTTHTVEKGENSIRALVENRDVCHIATRRNNLMENSIRVEKQHLLSPMESVVSIPIQNICIETERGRLQELSSLSQSFSQISTHTESLKLREEISMPSPESLQFFTQGISQGFDYKSQMSESSTLSKRCTSQEKGSDDTDENISTGQINADQIGVAVHGIRLFSNDSMERSLTVESPPRQKQGRRAIVVETLSNTTDEQKAPLAPTSKVVGHQNIEAIDFNENSRERFQNQQDVKSKARILNQSTTNMLAKSLRSKDSVPLMFVKAGSTKAISVSDEAIARANNLLNKNSSTKTVQVNKSLRPTEAVPMFATAGSGKAISVSDEAMTRANNLLNKNTSTKTAQVNKSSRPDGSVTPMLSTAGSGKAISVSDEAIARANNLLNKNTSTKTAQVNKISRPTEAVPMFVTAGSGIAISVSDEAMTRANNLLNNTSRTPLQLSAPVESLPTFSSAGSGKAIFVSDEAIARANNLLNNSDNNSGNNSGNKTPLKSATLGKSLPMFASAGSGKAISVSDEAIARANNLLNNTSRIPLQSSAPVESLATFSSAGSGKPISVSDEAITRANNLLNNTSRTPLQSATLGKSLPMFSTAGSGKAIFVSDEAMDRANKIVGETSDIVVDVRSNAIPSLLSTYGEDHGVVNMSVNLRNESSGRHENGSFIEIDSNEKNASAIPRDNLASFTPKQLPFTPNETNAHGKRRLVTRSTDVKNPYHRRRKIDVSGRMDFGAITPVPIAFNHRRKEEVTKLSSFCQTNYIKSKLTRSFRDKNISKVLDYSEDLSNESPASTHVQTQRNFNFSVGGGKLDLESFSAIYGPMNCDPRHCVKNGMRKILLGVSFENSGRLRFDEDGLPSSFFGQVNAYKNVALGSTKDLRDELLRRGCSDDLLSESWISNHYRHIIWKLTSFERRFPNALAGKYLTYSHVLCQLKNRFDKEIKGSCRPALRQILNRDAAASKMMILCVSKIMRKKMPEKEAEDIWLELTDGWYIVPAVLDDYLKKYVCRGKLRTGSKILVSNAVLEGADDGIDPLDREYTSSIRSVSIRLKVSANATRLCKWSAKLGFSYPKIKHSCGKLLIRSLKDVLPGGGSIPSIHLIVCKRYPVLFKKKSDDNPPYLLSETQNAQKQKEIEDRRQRFIDLFTDKAQKEAAEVGFLNRFLFLIKEMKSDHSSCRSLGSGRSCSSRMEPNAIGNMSE
jgi:breast cancer 2 susceptibility protein